MITIRLARGGAKKAPFYHIVVTDTRRPRDSGYKERLGYYNPVARGQATRLHMDKERVEYWLGQGAKFTDSVAGLWKQASKSDSAQA